MAVLTYRLASNGGKGSKLTHAELDANFTYLDERIDAVELGSGFQTQGDVLDDLNTLDAATGGDQYIYSTAAGVFAYGTVTSFARELLDDADASTARSTLGLAIGTDVLAQQTIGIADDNLLEVDGTPGTGEYARFTANGLEGRSASQIYADSYPGVSFLTSDSDQNFDVSSKASGTYRTGANWTATRTVTFIGTPPDGAWFRISNNSGQEVTITNGTGSPLDIPLDPFNLEKGNTILFETFASTSKLIKTERAWETTSERIIQFGGNAGDFVSKVTGDDFNYAWQNIDDLTADATPDFSADKLMTYDDSAGLNKKVALSAFQAQDDFLDDIAGLSDPGDADRVLFWDDSAGAITWLTMGTNLSISDTTLNASGGTGGGNVSSAGTPADNQIAVWTSDTQIEGDSGLTWDGTNLTTTGSIFLQEKADAAADSAGYGQLWVNTASPCELYFTDDTGNDREVVYSGGAFHDGFSDFVSNEHVDHSSVSLSAGAGIAGGGLGDLTANRTIAVDGVLEDLDTLGAAGSGDQMIYSDGAGSFAYTALTSFARGLLDDASATAARSTLGLVIGTNVLAQQTIGIANDNLLEVDGSPNSTEYARFTANGLEGRTEAEFKADFNLQIGTDVLAQQTIGIENDNLLEVDGTPNAAEYARFTAAGLEGRTEAEFKADFNLQIGTDVLAQQTIGISNDNLLEVDGTPNSGEWAKFTANGIEGRTDAEILSDLSLEIGTDVQAFGAVLDDFNTLGAAASDGQFIVATGAGAFAYESGATAAASMGVSRISGTPANNQLAVWTGATDIEGDANLTWDGAILRLEDDATGTSANAKFYIQRTTTGVDGMNIGEIQWRGTDDADASQIYGIIRTEIGDATASIPDGQMEFDVVVNNSLGTKLRLQTNIQCEANLDLNGKRFMIDNDQDTFLEETSDDIVTFDAGTGGELMRWDGVNSVILVGKSATDTTNAGIELNKDGLFTITRASAQPMIINRRIDDGVLLNFQQGDSAEGNISVSGATVSYNEFLGSHVGVWQTVPAEEPPVGTVLITTGEVTDDGRHPKVAISATQGDKKVYGVYRPTNLDEDTNFVAAVGIYYARVTGAVAAGDLLQASATPGVAEKQPPGWDEHVGPMTLGKALADYTPGVTPRRIPPRVTRPRGLPPPADPPDGEGLIPVALMAG